MNKKLNSNYKIGKKDGLKNAIRKSVYTSIDHNKVNR